MGHIKREIITALSVLASALLVIFYLIPNYIELEEKFELASLSPAFFPLIAAWIIAGLAGLHLISLLIRKKRGVDIDMDHEWLSVGEELNAYKSALVVIAYVFIIKYVGFIIATALTLVALLVLQDIRKPLKVISISVLVSVGVYLFFLFVMKVHFPKGWIFE